MESKELLKFCQELVKLKQRLKCPICFEILQDQIELICGHKFCSNCYNTHAHEKGKNITCPLCKTIIKRRSPIYKNELADKIGAVVSNIIKITEEAINCSIEEKIYHDDVALVRKTTYRSLKSIEEKSVNVAEKIVSKKKICKPTETKPSSSSFLDQPSAPSTSKRDAFDKLIEKFPKGMWFNKKGTTKTYPQKGEPKEKDNYKILEFHNTNTRDAVLHWLNDNKNKFHRLTQTQNIVEESEETIPVIDLTSVSQIHRKKIKPLKVTITKPKQRVSTEVIPIIDLTSPKRKCEKRSRSLDLELKVSNKEKSRLSDVGLYENYDIEESNTEEMVEKVKENAVRSIIEDKYLDKLEKELQKEEEKEKEHHTTQSSTSDWIRLEKILTTLNKKKSPKKLNITLQSLDIASEKKEKELKLKLTNKDISENKKKNIENGSNNNSSLADEKEHHESPETPYTDKKMISNNNSKQEANDIDLSDNTFNKNRKIQILNNIILNNSNIMTNKKPGECSKTQKLDKSDSILETNISFNELYNFDAVMNKLKTELQTYLQYIDKGKNLTKRHIEIIQRYMEKLNDLHEVIQHKIPTISNGTQTELPDLCYTYVQTDKVCYNDCEANASNSVWQKNVENINNPISNSLQKTHSSNTTKKHEIKTVKALKRLHSDEFAGSLDLLNFETQDIENQYAPNSNEKCLLSGKYVSQKNSDPQNISPTYNELIPTPINNNNIDLSLKSNTNVLICPLKSEANEKKRTLSESDSSDIVVTKKKCSRFIRDDLSIEFDVTEKPKDADFVKGLTPESDEENEEYLNKILKKFENIDKKCMSPQNVQNLNENCNKSVSHDIKTNSSSYHTATPRSGIFDDNVIFDDHNLSKIDKDVQLHTELEGESEFSDVIAETETENLEPLPKRPKLQNLNKAFSNDLAEDLQDPLQEATNVVQMKDLGARGDEGNQLAQEENSESIKKTQDIVKNKATYCQELEDSLDGVDFENIVMDEEVNQNNKNENVGKSNEDDLFSDDDDVVEGTPQKEKSIVAMRSQLNLVKNLTSFFPLLETARDEEIDPDFAPLAPPPGFEDNNDDTPSEEITVINLEQNEKEKPPTEDFQNTINQAIKSSLTPLNISIHKLPHSTPCTQSSAKKEILYLSPIVPEKSSFDKTFKSKNTIISINNETPRKSAILTSNPKQKSILNFIRTSQGSNTSHGKSKFLKPCIACTRLSKDQIQSISLLTNKKLATYSAKFNDSVTHMVIDLDENKRVKDYTMKFVNAVSCGIWVVGFEWIQDCLKNNEIISEEPYEALDHSGNPGPKMARLQTTRCLLKGYRFYCVKPLYSITVEDVEDVILKLGGIIVQNLESLSDNEDKINLIITEGRSTQDFEIYERWLEAYKVATVDIEWLSRSVGGYKIISIRPFVWCSDDKLDDLGYPHYLIEQVDSFSSELN